MKRGGDSRAKQGYAAQPRGTVILVALTVLLVLAGLAVVGVRLAANEVRAAQNHRMGRLVTSVADAGSQIAVGYAAGDPIGFAALVDSKVFANSWVSLPDLIDVQPYAWDAAEGGSLGWLGPALGTPDIRVSSDPSLFRQLSSFPGSAAGQFCSRVQVWRVGGIVGATPIEELSGMEEAPQFGSREFLVTAQIGPFPCGGQSP